MLVSVPASSIAAPAADASDRQVAFTRWEGGPALRTGTRTGLRLRHGSLVLQDASKQRAYRGTTYDVGSWTSAPVAPGFGFTQLVASWSALTPGNSWVEVRVKVAGGRWLVLGRWASSDRHVRRTSVPGQSDAMGRVDVDTWKAAFDGYERLRADNGVRRYRILRSVAEPQRVLVHLDFDSDEDAAAFLPRLARIWASPLSQAQLVGHAPPELLTLITDRVPEA